MAPFRVTEATLDVLEVLLTEDDQLYGLKIANAIGRPTGSVFPILARLEDCGWVTSAWESGDTASRGPRRRFYQLTGSARVDARALLANRRGVKRKRVTRTSPVLNPGVEGAR